MPPDKNSSNDRTISQKYLEKIIKMQQDQEGARQQEFELLRMHLAQMNILLDQLIKVSESGSTVAATKKTIPFQTGSQEVGQLNQQPANPDAYPTRIDVYSINNSRIIPHMTLINDGPGDIFFINTYAKDVFNVEEEHLNVNDQRELFNVYEIRLRSTLPLTTIRLIEGIFRTGGVAPNTIANVEVRPTTQANQIFKVFSATFDIYSPITITSPTVQNFPVTQIGLQFQPPLPPGATAALVDLSTGLPMPFTIPEDFSLEAFGLFTNMSTDFSVRGYFGISPGVFLEANVFPISNRGLPFAQSLNLSFFSSQPIFPLGAPSGGFPILLTITNDDPFNNMIGDFNIITILSRLQ